MSNLTVSVDDELIKLAKVRAIQQGTSLSAKVREFLTAYASGAENPGSHPRQTTPVLPVSRARGGLITGLDPGRNQSMLEASASDRPPA
jgi:plasmid stability protein